MSKGMVNPPSIEELRVISSDLPKNRRRSLDEIGRLYFQTATEAKHLFERWLYTESDLVFREWQFKAKQAAQLKVSINIKLGEGGAHPW